MPCRCRSRCSPRPAVRGCAAPSPATPATRKVVDRFVAGEALDDALGAVRALCAPTASRSPSTTWARTSPTRAEAEHSRDAYLRAARRAGAARARRRRRGVGEAVGVRPGAARRRTSSPLELVRPVVEAATAIGTTVTLDMEDHRTVDATLGALAELRKEHPGTGAVLQAMLFRTEDDAKALAVTGSRVRLVKGAYNEPASRRAPEQGGRRRRLRALPGDPHGRRRATRWSARTTRR